MPLYEVPKKRLWPNVWKGIGLLLIVLLLASVVTGKHWQTQGDELNLLPPSQWGFGGINLDCVHGSGPVYFYGFIARTPQSTLNACRR